MAELENVKGQMEEAIRIRFDGAYLPDPNLVEASEQLRAAFESYTSAKPPSEKFNPDDFRNIFKKLPDNVRKNFNLQSATDLECLIVGGNLDKNAKLLENFDVPEILDGNTIGQLRKELFGIGQQLIRFQDLGTSYPCIGEAPFQLDTAGRRVKTFREKLEETRCKLLNFLGGEAEVRAEKPQDETGGFRDKLEHLLARLSKKKGNDVSEDGQHRTARECVSIIDHYLCEIGNFSGGNFFQTLSLPRPDLSGTLSSHDARTPYRMYGINDLLIADLYNNLVTVSRVQEYADLGMLDGEYDSFLRRNIPAKNVHDYLKLFSPQELHANKDVILGQSAADAIAIASSDADRERTYNGLRILALGVRNYNWRMNIRDSQLDYQDRYFTDAQRKQIREGGDYLLLKLLSEREPDPTKQTEILRDYQEVGLTKGQVLTALKASYPPEYFRNAIKENPEIAQSGQDAFHLLLGDVDRRELMSVLVNLPRGARSVSEVLDFKKDLPLHLTIKDTIPYFKVKPLSSIDCYVVIPQLIAAGITPQQVAEYASIGGPYVRSYRDILTLIENKVPPEYVRQATESHQLSKIDGTRPLLVAAFRQGIALPELTVLSEKLDRGVIRDLLKNGELRALAAKSPSEQKQLLPYLKIPLNLGDAEFAIGHGASAELVEFLSKHFLGLRDVLESFSVSEVEQRIQKEKDGLVESDSFAIEVRLRKKGFPPEEISEIVCNGFPARLAESLRDAGENWRDYRDLNARFHDLDNYETFNLLRIAHFVGLTADDLSAFATSAHSLDKAKLEFPREKFDIAILKKRQAGNLAPEMANFLDQYNLTFLSRYPVEMLRLMKEGYNRPGRENFPNAILVASKSDWNSAFEKDSGLYNKFLDAYNVYVYETPEDSGLLSAVKDHYDFLKKKGKEIDLLIVGGHGSRTSLELSAYGDIDASHLDLSDENLLSKIDKLISKSAQVILIACSTGEGGIAANNLKALVSKQLNNRETFAPAISPNLIDVEFLNGRVWRMIFKDQFGNSG